MSLLEKKKLMLFILKKKNSSKKRKTIYNKKNWELKIKVKKIKQLLSLF